MSPVGTRRIVVGGQTVEIWESPEVCFELTPLALRSYLLRGAWVTLFNALSFQGPSTQEH